MSYVWLIIGFVLLVKGADFFVSGSSKIARYFRIPAILIGLTIVAFGTSAPEAAVSITAAARGQNGIAVGNLLGSNLFNLLAVVGICALIRPIRVHGSVVFKEYPFMVLSSAALLALGSDAVLDGTGVNQVSRGDGAVLLLFFCVFLYMTIRSALVSRAEIQEAELHAQAEQAARGEKEKPISLPISILVSLGGLAGVVLGGQLVVNSDSEIARSFGISESLIGLTIVAIGTSLPELVTSVVAARKGEADMAIGNVVGSNLFNIFFILGTSAVIHPLPFPMESVWDSLILIGVSVVVYLFILTKRMVNRIEGGIMVAMYAAYTAYILMR